MTSRNVGIKTGVVMSMVVTKCLVTKNLQNKPGYILRQKCASCLISENILTKKKTNFVSDKISQFGDISWEMTELFSSCQEKTEVTFVSFEYRKGLDQNTNNVRGFHKFLWNIWYREYSLAIIYKKRNYIVRYSWVFCSKSFRIK